MSNEYLKKDIYYFVILCLFHDIDLFYICHKFLERISELLII